MPDYLIKNISEIATPTSGVKRGKQLSELSITHGDSIYIKDGLIREMGDFDTIKSDIDGNPHIIDGIGKTAIPGFIDSHTHLVFGGRRENEFGQRIKGATYREIAESGGGIKKTVADTRKASKNELVEYASVYLANALQNGTTTMEVKTGYGLDLDTELKMLEVIDELNKMQPVELIPTFLGAHTVPEGLSKNDYIVQVLEMIPAVSGRAKYCDVFCEEGYFSVEDTRKILEKGLESGLKPRIHVDQFTDSGGLKLGIEIGACSVDHLEVISDEDIQLLAKSNTAAAMLPGVSFFLNYGYPPARKIIDSGCITVIATDFNPGSCMCISMQLIMSIACTQMKMSPEESLNASTVNAAYSLELENVGVLEPRKQADILIMDVPNFQVIPYYFGMNHVETVIKNGKIAWSRN
jgi:imidazolonepropionase